MSSSPSHFCLWDSFAILVRFSEHLLSPSSHLPPPPPITQNGRLETILKVEPENSIFQLTHPIDRNPLYFKSLHLHISRPFIDPSPPHWLFPSLRSLRSLPPPLISTWFIQSGGTRWNPSGWLRGPIAAIGRCKWHLPWLIRPIQSVIPASAIIPIKTCYLPDVDLICFRKFYIYIYIYLYLYLYLYRWKRDDNGDHCYCYCQPAGEISAGSERPTWKRWRVTDRRRRLKQANLLLLLLLLLLPG